jgi:hypothetical protein
MHKLRIIIYGETKIMINSQEVYFDITRQCAHVELKNINIFSTKNHLCRFYRNGKYFYKMIYNITLCNCWHRI